MINANGNAAVPVARGRDRPLGCRVEADHGLDGQRPAVSACPDLTLLRERGHTYAEIGLFDGQVPDITTLVNTTLVAGLYDADGTVIWPVA